MDKRVTRKKKKKQHKIGKILLVSLLMLILIGAASAVGMTIAVVKSSPEINSDIINNLHQSSKIFDKNGNYIEDYSDSEVRSVLTLNQIPTQLQNSFIAIEDERFYQHHGIDIKRIFGALWVDIRTRSSAQGASTITQQLVKNTALTQEKKLSRKLQEAYLAIQLERKLSKQQILEAYLNTIYLGGSSYGVEAAAENYFGKSVGELSLSQCAFLAGLNKNPAKYYPYSTLNSEVDSTRNEITSDSVVNYPSAALNDKQASKEVNSHVYLKYKILYERRNVVLSQMKNLGYINQAQYEEAKGEELKFRKKEEFLGMKYQWFIEPAINEIAKDFSDKYGISTDEAKQKLRIGGYNIYLTIDPKIQQAAEDVINDNSNYKNARLPKDMKMYTAEKKNPNSDVEPLKLVQPQAAAVIFDYTTGQMRAIVGGRGKHPRLSINRATEVPRQPGSSIKPLAVYGPGIDTKTITASTVVNDAAMSSEFSAAHGGWKPHDYETGKFSGYVTIREAIMKSINIVAIKVADMLNPDPPGGPSQNLYGTSIDYLVNKFHLSTIQTTGPNSDRSLSPLALGALTKGVYPYEMAAAYGVFGNNGMYSDPIMYTKVTDNRGNLILEKTTKQTQSISPQAAYIMTDMLKGVVKSGTGTRANLGSMPAAGKTGTAADNTNLWFVGFTPYLSGAVWIGHDMPKIPLRGLKSSDAASMWGKIMKVANKGLPVKDFTKPTGLVAAPVCIDSGLAPSELCSQDPRGSRVRSEIFIDGTQPVEICNIHVAGQIDITTGKAPTLDSLPENIKTRVYINRNNTQSNQNSQSNTTQDLNNQGNTTQDLNNQNTETDNTFDTNTNNNGNNETDTQNTNGNNNPPNQ